MRVIAGKFKGRRFEALHGLDVRPTSDKLRETLFNIISQRVKESHFLDLCAGSGAIGIEALSRGASEATFIEHSRRAYKVINENLRHCGVNNGAHIIHQDALKSLKHISADRMIKFDCIYFDPPYESDLYMPVLSLLGAHNLLNEDGIVIVEHRRNRELPEKIGNLTRYREVIQGDSGLSFYQIDPEDAA